MCTLTYVPTKSGFIVTSNRDESIHRGKAIAPAVHSLNGVKLLMPQDPEKLGTWIGVSDKGRVAVLLNGAFARHQHKPPYKKSRGLVLVDSFAFDDLTKFATEYDFRGIEPFTIITMSRGGKVWDFRWDGERSHLSSISSRGPHVWCSAQMYSKEIQNATTDRFHEFLQQQPEPAPRQLVQFNRSEGYVSKMEKAGQTPFSLLQTVSISSLSVGKDEVTFEYFDAEIPQPIVTRMPLN